MKNFKNYFLIRLVGVVVLSGCKKDDDPTPPPCNDPSNPGCPNYDPCFEESPITAEFKIYDDVFSGGPNSDHWFEDDVLWKGRIKFEAIEQDANYKWYLGQQTIEGTDYQEVVKTLVDLNPGTYTAALRVEKEPNLECFPNDAGVDSTFRTFQVVNVCDLKIMNRFKGVFESNPLDSVEIRFFYYKLDNSIPQYVEWCDEPTTWGTGMAFVNLNGQNDTIPANIGGILNRYWEQNTNQFHRPKGWFEVYPDNTCRGEYLLRGENIVFTGKMME